MLVEIRVQSLALDRHNNTPVVILKEVDGERMLPIWIGPGEATSIAMQLADMKFERPLTHDLLCSVLGELGGVLKKVVITKVENRTYFAELVVRCNGEVVTVDARPSDSIAVALRADARIFADDELLLEEATIEIADEETVEEVSGGGFVPHETVLDLDADEETESMGAEELQAYLKRLNPEDFGRFIP